MTLVYKSHGIGDMAFEIMYFNPIYESGDKITPDIIPKCGLMHCSCPDKF